ncbi:MAG: helicase C-terminal domain-containing protein [Simkaniaceae bacterium]|nr:helicase C-terminal domain-containing protein [Candidatus Sacchlamyda saccharinae]
MAETLSLFNDIFLEGGLLNEKLSDYESREGQQEMAAHIWTAFEQDETALFEAGTGIGKSLAYLIPALMWSYRTGEKIVISTHTISLQEQLINKDLPFLLDVLGVDLRVVLAKGMGNYVCLRKLDDLSKKSGVYDQSVDALASWSQKTQDGSRSAVPFAMQSDTWGKVYAESDACSYIKCPHYKQCFFFKARNKAQDADVIIVNHHLLMAHLQSEEDRAILPPFSRLIIDEAHHLESVARSSLTEVLDRVRIMKALGRVHSEVDPGSSRLFAIRDLIKDKGLKTRLDIDLPGEKRSLLDDVHAAFDKLDVAFARRGASYKWRITEQALAEAQWAEELMPAFGTLKEKLKRYAASLLSIEKELDDETKEKVEHALVDIGQAAERLEEVAEQIEAFFKEKDVRWAEKTYEGTTLSATKLDVAPFLEEKLFEPLKSAILCSATLSVGSAFTHVKNNLGLQKEVIEKIYPSPFDFQNRTRLLGIKDLSAPNSYSFISEAAEVIREATSITGGGAFVLFTSYDMLNKCANALEDLPILKQGDRPRHQLLEEFKKCQNGILFGTDSFWEGVDVAGDALRLVIIVKLPFPVPSEPLLEAKSELLRSQDRDPFMEDSIPQAVMKFKQGFGRLMRRAEDRGCVLCLDQRLFTKRYGKIFLESLPECLVSYDSKSLIYSEIKQFYK